MMLLHQKTLPAAKRFLNGFTLIELLVVVLVIGILAAIALPQYQLAVEKSRALQAVVFVKATSDALERYYMANGDYGPSDTIDFSLLDISMPDMVDFEFLRYRDMYVAAVKKGSRGAHYIISKTLYNTNQGAWKERGITCNTSLHEDGNDLASRLCKSLCGVSTLTQVWPSGEFGCELK